MVSRDFVGARRRQRECCARRQQCLHRDFVASPVHSDSNIESASARRCHNTSYAWDEKLPCNFMHSCRVSRFVFDMVCCGISAAAGAMSIGLVQRQKYEAMYDSTVQHPSSLTNLGKGNLQLFPIEVTCDVDSARSTFISEGIKNAQNQRMAYCNSRHSS